MKIIVLGCGRVGEQFSRLMADKDHDVTVIDYDAAALARLGPEFKGQRVHGIGFDRRILAQAGIARADAFAATSASDNANIVAARLAHNVFHVPKVVARLYDPRRAEIYRRLGLVTISSTTWGAERIYEVLMHGELDPDRSFGHGEVTLQAVEAPPHWVGRSVRELCAPGEVSVAVLTRGGRAVIPGSGTILRAGDVVHLVVAATGLTRLEEWLGLNGGD